MFNAFNVLFNNACSNKAPNMNTYEVSVVLTKAQDELVRTYFFTSGEGLKGFDGNQKRQIDFSKLLKEGSGTLDTDATGGVYDPRAFKFWLPPDVLFLVNESLYFKDNNEKVQSMVQVIPLAYDEYTRLMNKPYKEPLKNQAWRLLVQNSTPTGEATPSATADIIIRSTDFDDYLLSDRSNAEDLLQYAIRYVRIPKPIIIENLSTYSDSLKIHGEVTASDCELDETVHEEIVQRAVELAKAVWLG